MLSTLLTFAARTYRYGGDYYYNSGTTSADAAELFGVGMAVFILFFLFAIGLSYVVTSLFFMVIFKKAGLKTSAAWIPFYNNWKFYELGGQPGWMVLINLIPLFGAIVASVFMVISAYNIGLKLGKSGVFVLLFIFFAPAWYLILGLDDSKWNDSLGQASLAEGTILGYATEEEVKQAEAETPEK